jgi:K+-sensing histidine kinase KdpD
VHADADLLAAALLNLLDNAQRHGATRVQVSTPAPDTLRLHDNGPGVDDTRRQALGSALAAQDYDAVPGLGLTLSDLVARAHGGMLSLPPVPTGFAVELQLRPA